MLLLTKEAWKQLGVLLLLFVCGGFGSLCLFGFFPPSIIFKSSLLQNEIFFQNISPVDLRNYKSL